MQKYPRTFCLLGRLTQPGAAQLVQVLPPISSFTRLARLARQAGLASRQLATISRDHNTT